MKRNHLLTAFAIAGVTLFIGTILAVTIATLIQAWHKYGPPPFLNIIVYLLWVLLVAWGMWSLNYLIFHRKK